MRCLHGIGQQRQIREVTAAAVVCLSLLATSARAATEAGTAGGDAASVASDDDAALRAAEDAEVLARLRFIERRLEGEAACAQAWTWSWVGFNAAAGGYEVYRAVGAGNSAERVDEIVGGAKALIGIIGRLARPLSARMGAAELRGIAEATPGERARKLAFAERLLERNARQAAQRHALLPHVLNASLNLAGAIVVWVVANAPGTAWLSAGIGVAVGEVVIWTQPTRASQDLGDYERHFGLARTTVDASGVGGVAVALVPLRVDGTTRLVGGGALELRF
jgi:hypothetical protein